MAQHDMNIANQGFPATRADLNNALQALVSNSSGTSAPSTTFANQWWYDTTNNKLYIRNEANNAWIEVAVLDQTNNEWQISTGVIQAKDSDGLALKTDDGTTRLFIKDSDGAIGIGTTSPDYNLHISSDQASACRLLLESTAGSAADGPILDIYRNSATPDADDNIGIIYFSGEDDAGNKHQYARMDAFIENATSGSEDGRLTVQLVSGGTNKQFLGMRADTGGADGEVVFNESQNDINFRIESDSATNLFVADASTHRVGISTSSPRANLEVYDGDVSGVFDAGNLSTWRVMQVRNNIESNTGTAAGIALGGDGTSDTETAGIVGISDNSTGGVCQLAFITSTGNNSIERARIDSSGRLLVGKTATSQSTAGGTLEAGSILGIVDGGNCLRLNRLTDDGDVAQFRQDGADIGAIQTAGSNLVVRGNNAGLKFRTSDILPTNGSGTSSDNTEDLGDATARFDDVFATNGTIQTSDQNEKQQIASLTDAEITAAKAISKLFKTFKWNDKVEAKGDAARTHTGVIAQQVETAMSDAGLDASKYAFWCSDTWWQVDGDEAYDTQEEAPEGATERNRKGIRYPELLSFIGAATEQRLTSIEARLDALEG